MRPALYINLESSTDTKTDKKDPKSNTKDKTTKKDSESNKSNTGKKSDNKYASSQKGDIIKFGSYEQDDDWSNGKESIEWIVLDKTDSSLFLLSKYALDCQPYNTRGGSVTWEASSLRSWLNNDFYDTAFNKTEKSMIKETTVKNVDNPYYGTEGGRNTKDKVFLLSISEVTNTKFGFDSDTLAYDINRRCAPTDYAVTQGALQDSVVTDDDNIGICRSWLLRSPGSSSYYAAYVCYDGRVSVYGDNVDYFDAVRPALFINLKS